MISFARRHLDRSLPPLLRRLAHFLFRTYYNMGDCSFCKIVAGKANADIVYKDEHVTAFRDTPPLAPTHILFLPNRHTHPPSPLPHPAPLPSEPPTDLAAPLPNSRS